MSRIDWKLLLNLYPSHFTLVLFLIFVLYKNSKQQNSNHQANAKSRTYKQRKPHCQYQQRITLKNHSNPSLTRSKRPWKIE